MLLRMARVIYDECLCVYVCRWKCDCAGGDNRSVFIKHFFFLQKLQLFKIYRFISINCVGYIDSGEWLHLDYSERKMFMEVCDVIHQGIWDVHFTRGNKPCRKYINIVIRDLISGSAQHHKRFLPQQNGAFVVGVNEHSGLQNHSERALNPSEFQ